MIRKFYLENSSGNKFYFGYQTSTLISNITGLGFTKEFIYLKYGEYYDRVADDYPMSDIQASLMFLNGYKGYLSFLNYLKLGDKNLVLYYDSSDVSYCQIEIKSMSKGELDAGTLKSEIIIQKKSLWLKKQSLFIDVNVIPIGKVYSYSYPYQYSSFYEGRSSITNRGITKAPLLIEMYGAVNEPEIVITKNSVVVSRLKLYVVANDGEIIISSIPTNQYMKQRIDGVETSIYELQDFQEDNFLFVEPGDYSIEFKPGVSSPTTCRITMLEGYLGV
jgi:hypothetical protein